MTSISINFYLVDNKNFKGKYVFAASSFLLKTSKNLD